MEAMHKMSPEKTRALKNWWYYYKWYVICSIILLGVVIHLIGNALGLWNPKPDIQIAYIGKEPLPDDTIEALEKAFASIGGDFNGDGSILIQINQYATYASNTPSNGNDNGDAEADDDRLLAAQASETRLIGDIMDSDSYFFLMDDPEQFQKKHQLLALPDGSCPANLDFSVEDKTIRWADCSLLSSMELGTYTETLLGEEQTGENQQLLENLYLGRRCFYGDKRTDNWEACSDLWDVLKKETTP